jgi:hypothetical protein
MPLLLANECQKKRHFLTELCVCGSSTIYNILHTHKITIKSCTDQMGYLQTVFCSFNPPAHKGKEGKGKVYPRTGNEGPEGEQM